MYYNHNGCNTAKDILHVPAGFTHSPRHPQSIPPVMSNTGRGGDVFSYPPINIKSESPTMMITDQSQESENVSTLVSMYISIYLFVYL